MELPTLDAPVRARTGASRVTVVIATRDRRALLEATLRRLEQLPEAPAVVVVDDASRDGTAAMVAERFPAAALSSLPSSRGAAARNAGVARAAGPYVALTDDDAHWAPGALAAAAAILDAHPEVALVAPRILVGAAERLDPVSVAMAGGGLEGGPDLPGEPVLGFVACAAVVRRSAFAAVGGFDARYGLGGEERRLALDLAAAGWQLRYVPWVVAHHHPPAAVRRPGRRATTLRNDLWTSWLHRHPGPAARETARLVRAGGARRSTLSALAGALAGAPWVLRERRVLPAQVGGWLDALD